MRIGVLLVAGLVVLIVLAVVFRSRRAAEALRFLRKVAWIYIAAIVALALWELATDGL